MSMSKKCTYCKITAILLVLMICINVSAFSNEPVKASSGSDKRIRVDIGPNLNGRTDMYTKLWNNWVVNSGTSAETTFNGVTFKLSNGGEYRQRNQIRLVQGSDKIVTG